MTLKKWLFNVFIKKAIKRGIQIVIAFVAGSKLAQMGVTIDETALSAGIWTALEAGRQWLKVKYEWNWI